MKNKNDYEKDFFFENVIQNVYSDYQNVKRDSVQYVRNLKKAIAQMDKKCFFVILPIGLSVFMDESNRTSVLYNDSEISDFYQLIDNKVIYRHFDQLEIALVNNCVEVSNLGDDAKYLYKLDSGMFQSATQQIQLGVPSQQCQLRQNTYFDFMPDIYQIMVKGEFLPKCMWPCMDCYKTQMQLCKKIVSPLSIFL